MSSPEVGLKFNRWTIIGPGPGGKCLAKCDCGEVRSVSFSHIRFGNSKSCGCFRSEETIRKSTKHGMVYSKMYRVWASMVNRATNKNHPANARYSGRGITICDRWLKFENFYEDMGERPSPEHEIDRINNDDGYYKENCRWVTSRENNRNRSSSKIIERDGRSMCLKAWCETLGIAHKYQTIKVRMINGMSFDEAISKPIRRCNRSSASSGGLYGAP